jgi:hypothetical protein
MLIKVGKIMTRKELADAMVKMFDIPTEKFGKPGFFMYNRWTGELCVKRDSITSKSIIKPSNNKV